MKHIGIVGAGHVGEVLASRLVRVGHKVKVANSRGPDSLVAFARRTGAEATDIDSISSGVDIIVFAVPMNRIGDLPKAIIQTLPHGAIVLDAGNYYPLRDGAIAAIDDGLPESEWVSRQLGVPVTKAFNNIIASSLATGGRPADDRRRIALPVAGDDPTARAEIMALVEQIGFDAFDAGPLAGSWRQQPGQPAYCTDPTRDELPLLLRRADRTKAPLGRDRAFKIVARLPRDYPARRLVQVSRLFVGLDKAKPANWFALLRLGVTLLRAKEFTPG